MAGDDDHCHLWINLLDRGQHIQPVPPRQLDVQEGQVEAPPFEQLEPFLSPQSPLDFKALLFQSPLAKPDHIRLVVNHQNSLCGHGHPFLCPSVTGSITVKVLPRPTSLSTSIQPPCLSTMLWLIERPKPVP